MAVKFKESVNGEMTYTIIPEVITPDELEHVKQTKFMSEDGYMKGQRGYKQIGEVPYSVLYNYAKQNGVHTSEMNEWYAADKGRNMRKLLNEFTTFRLGSKKV